MIQKQFFGRKNELDILLKAWEKVCKGQTQVVLIGGEPTIGKTALCNAFYNHLSHDPLLDPDDYWPDNLPDTELKFASFRSNKPKEVLDKWEKVTPKYLWFSAGCAPRDSSERGYNSGWLQPWMDIPKGLEGKRCLSKKDKVLNDLKILGFDVAWEGIGAATGLPLLKAILWDIPKKVLEYGKSSHAMFDNFDEWNEAERNQAEAKILNLLTEVSSDKNGFPTVVFIDDLHWADPDSCRLLARLCREKRQNRLLILGTYRSIDIKTDTWIDTNGKTCYPPFHSTLMDLKRYSGEMTLTNLELGSLPEDDFVGFIKSQFQGNNPDKALLKGLVQTMHGQPFFTLHFCKLLIQEGLLTQEGNFPKGVTWGKIKKRIDNLELPVPGDVEAVIHERLERLSGELRQILACGSAMGLRFSGGFLLKALDQLGRKLTPLQLANAMSPLVNDHKLLNQVSTDNKGFKQLIQEFAHIMIYQASHSTLSEGENRLLSEEIGRFAFGQLRGESAKDLSFIEVELLLESLVTSLEGKESFEFLGKENNRTSKEIVADLKQIADLAHEHGKISKSLALNKKIVEIKEEYIRRNCDDMDAQVELAVSHDTLGCGYLYKGDIVNAQIYYEKALKIREHLAERGICSAAKDLFLSYFYLGDICVSRCDFDNADEYYQKCFGHVEDYYVLSKLGYVRLCSGSLDRAQWCYEQVIEILERRIKKGIRNDTVQDDLSENYYRLGNISMQLGDFENSQKYFEKSLAIRELLAQVSPTNRHYQRDLGASYNGFGDLYEKRSEPTKAKKHYEKGLEIRKRLSELDPANSQAQEDLSRCYDNLGRICDQLSDLVCAQSYYRESLEIFKCLADIDTTNNETEMDLAVACNNVAYIFERQGDFNNAKQYYEKSINIKEHLVDVEHGDIEYRIYLANSYQSLGYLFEQHHYLIDAQKYYEKALDCLDKIDPIKSITLDNLAILQNHYEVYCGIAKHLFDLNSGKIEIQRVLAIAYSKLGTICELRNLAAEAQSYYEKGLKIALSLKNIDPTTNKTKETIANCFRYCGKFEEAAVIVKELLGNPDELYDPELLKWYEGYLKGGN